MMGACLSSSEDSRGEPRHFGGCVMSGKDFTLDR